MVAQKAKSIRQLGNHTCKKCGSAMYKRVIAVKQSKSFNFEKILQCNVCRYWIKLK